MKHFNDQEIYDALFGMLGIFHPKVPPELVSEIIVRSPIDKFKSGKIILEEGQVCTHCYFIMDGFTKSVFRHLNMDVIAWFMGKRHVIISVESFLKQTPSKERIIALKDTVCMKLHYDDWQWLRHNFHEFALIDGGLFHHYYLQSIEREKWKALDARERYINLLEKYPDIVEQALQEDIASFLCISKYTLSRIVNNL